MIELHFRNRDTSPAFVCTASRKVAGMTALKRRVETVRLCSWSGRDDHLPACFDKLRERISERRRDRSGVVQNHERVFRNARRIDRSGALQRERERQIFVRRQRALQMQAVAATARSAFDDQSLRRSFASQSEIETIVRSEIAGDDIDRAAICAFIQIETGKLNYSRVATVKTDVALLDRLLVDLEIDLDVIRGVSLKLLTWTTRLSRYF